MKKIISPSLLVIGSTLLLCALNLLYFITSDIPINYSTNEAIFVHLFVFVATLIVIISSLQISKKSRIIVIIFFTLFASVNLLRFINDTTAEYYNSSFALLTLAFILQPLLIVLFNIFLLFSPKIKE